MRSYLFLLTGFLVFAACTQPDTVLKTVEVKYPDTKKDTTVTDDYFGTKVADPYRWLEDDRSAETAAWVKAENAVTQDYLAQIPFREAIKKRYETIYNYEKYSAPFKQGDFIYYYKNTGLQNQDVLYREPVKGGEAEVFLDPNSFSKDGTTSLAGMGFSKDGSMVAFNLSEGGSDWQKLAVMNAVTKQMLTDTLELKFSGASWKGNEGFYYCNYKKLKEGDRKSVV
jgi:prolyl oligopeptidase